MRFSTTDGIPGHVCEVIGLLMDTETLGLHAGRDLLLRLTDKLGGRSRVMDKQAQVALEAAAKRLADRAAALGADAVVGVRLIVQPVGIKRTAMVQAVIYGTAVRLKPLAPAAEERAGRVQEGAC
ncbi:heavy metal-binding domain-containing protein [Nitrospira calida]|jgi:uncharacterized protein YbjQ (UPF0145 family)